MMCLGHHIADNDATKYNDEKRESVCLNCSQALASFWIDGDEDRRPHWSHWTVVQFVIQELYELPA